MFEYDIPLSEPERSTISRIPKNINLRTAFYGPDIRDRKLNGLERPSLQRPFLRMPPVAETQIAIRSNGPCRQCRTFLQKLVRLVQEENTGISGVLELSAHGHSIHDILSERSREFLGAEAQTLLGVLLASDSTHDISHEFRQPCQEYASCPKRLC